MTDNTSETIEETTEKETITEKVIREMLTENTGKHFLDSGFEYGRHWQQNQHRNFKSEPSETLKFSTYQIDGETKIDISVTLNVYHWLVDHLTFNSELDKILHGRFLQERDQDNDKCWLELMDEFPEYLGTLTTCDWIPDEGLNDEQRKKLNRKTELAMIDEPSEEEIKELEEINSYISSMRPTDCEEEGEPRFGDGFGIYGEGKPITVNTYNGEDLLSQVLQYIYFTNQSGEFVVLQIHGGADVRGGYTAPHVFELNDELNIFNNAKAVIHCTGRDRLPEANKFFEKRQDFIDRSILPGMEKEFWEETKATRELLLELQKSHEHYWETDDAYNWYHQGSCGAGTEPKLNSYDVVNFDDDDNELNVEVDEDVKQQTWEPGKLCIKDGNGYCPYCGGKLEAGYY